MTWNNDDTAKKAREMKQKESNGTGLGILAAVAIGACCAGPLIIAAVVAAAKSAGAPLVVLGLVALAGIGAVWARRRRRASDACCPPQSRTIEQTAEREQRH